MSTKTYSPVASYMQLKQVESKLEQAQTIEDVGKILKSDGSKIGYKAFCYMLMGKMTSEAMKPDEAAVVAMELQQKGNDEAAKDIFQRILAAHPELSLASRTSQADGDDIPNWITGCVES